MEGRRRLLSVSEAAEFLGVSAASLRKWSDQGRLPVYRTPGGQRRYSLADLRWFIDSMRDPRTRSPTPDTARPARRQG